MLTAAFVIFMLTLLVYARWQPMGSGERSATTLIAGLQDLVLKSCTASWTCMADQVTRVARVYSRHSFNILAAKCSLYRVREWSAIKAHCRIHCLSSSQLLPCSEPAARSRALYSLKSFEQADQILQVTQQALLALAKLSLQQ